MKRFLCFFSAFVALFFTLSAQIITTSPEFPTEDDQVTIVFDATKGTGGLKDFTGDVYAHTGVITSKSTGSSDWKYAPSWGTNTAKYKMTRIDKNKWSLTITPSVRQYYGVPAAETIKQMAFVFRSSDNKLEGKDTGGKDIYADIYASGLTLRFDQPTTTLFNQGESTAIKVAASAASTITLSIGNTQIASAANVTELSANYTFAQTGAFTLKAVATSGTLTAETTLSISVSESTQQETMPKGVRPGINYISDTEATLVLQIPGKKHAYVIGDFNDWKYSNAYQMKQDGEYFWLTLKGLEKGTEYAFQYVVDQSITVADPYAAIVLDPWNDPHIPASVYPNLKSYPTGKTEGIVSVLQTGQAPYQWKVQDFQKPDKNHLMVYELHIRDFTKQHSYQAAIEKLPYLKTLGVNAIELMPVNEFEGNTSWGYNPSFYFAVDKYYGTRDDLKAFVDACHVNGMAVILDLVLNHSFSQCPFYQLYRDADGRPSKNSPWYNQESNIPNDGLQWGYDFNHDSKYTRAFVDSVAAYWMDEYKFDGFRYDFTKGFSNTAQDEWANLYDAARISNLKRICDEIWKRNSDAYVIIEHLTNGTSEEKTLGDYGMMLWRNMSGAYATTAKGYKADFTGLNAISNNMPFGSLMGYMESHDEERNSYEAKTSGISTIKTDLATRMKQAATNAAFFFTVPGPKMIWQFGELGYDISIDYNGRTGEKPVLWEYADVPERQELYQNYANLIALRLSYPDLFGKNARFNQRVNDTYWANGRCIYTYCGNDALVVVGNFTSSEVEVSSPFPKAGTYYEFLNETYSFNIATANSNKSITVPAHSYRIFTNFVPDITGIEDTDLSPYLPAIIYDRAADEVLIDGDVASVAVYTVQGQMALSVANSDRLSLSTLMPGAYIVQARLSNGEVLSSKLVR